MTWIFIVIGFGAGILSGLFGIGGGILIVPALILLMKMPPIQATGTSLGVFLFPVGILGAYEYYKRGNMNITASLWIGLGLLAGAYIGARFAQDIPQFYLKRMFAVFLVAVAARMWWSA